MGLRDPFAAPLTRLPTIMLHPTLTSLALLLAPAASFARSDVHVLDVAGGPGADFTSLGEAVAGASDGDIIVIRSGYYFQFLGTPVSGKGLTLVAEGDVELTGVRISDLGPGQAFTIRGVRGQMPIELDDNEGAVWLEEVTDNSGSSFAHLNVEANSCSNLVLNRCALEGSSQSVGLTPGLRAVQSSVHAFDSVLIGGAGAPFGGPGDPALEMVDSFLFAEGCAFQHPVTGTIDADQSGASDSIFLDCDGVMTVTGGTHAAWLGAARSFEATALAREGEVVTMRWEGMPGELAILNLATKPGALLLPQFHGVGTLGLPLTLIKGMGVIPASGVLEVGIPIPELGAGVEGAVFFAQGSFAELSTSIISLGGGSAITLLDQSF